MARYRRRFKRKYRGRRDKGLFHDLKLYFTSRARVKGAVAGMLVSPLVIHYTDFGKNVAGWIVKQSERLRS